MRCKEEVLQREGGEAQGAQRLRLSPLWNNMGASVYRRTHASVGWHAKAQFFTHLAKSSL